MVLLTLRDEDGRAQSKAWKQLKSIMAFRSGDRRRPAQTVCPNPQSTSHTTESERHQPLLSSPYAANTKGSLEQKSNQSSLGGFSPQQCLATLVALLVTKK